KTLLALEQLVLLHRLENHADVLRSVVGAGRRLGVGGPDPRGPDQLLALRGEDGCLRGHGLYRAVGSGNDCTGIEGAGIGALDATRISVGHATGPDDRATIFVLLRRGRG